MQDATVLYLADAATISPDLEWDRELLGLGLDPAWTELAASARGWPSPQDAALWLAERGAGRVEFRSARRDAAGSLELGAVAGRLFG